jgi:hypothetical protein
LFGVESGLEKKLFSGPFLDHDFEVVQPLTKLPGELVENAGHFFPEVVLIHR